MGNIPHRKNTWSLVSGATWVGSRNMVLDGGSTSLGVGFQEFTASLHLQWVLYPPCLWLDVVSACYSNLLPRLPRHYGPSHQNHKLKEPLLVRVFITATDKELMSPYCVCEITQVLCVHDKQESSYASREFANSPTHSSSLKKWRLAHKHVGSLGETEAKRWY